MLEIIQGILAMLMVFVIPGYLLSKLLFPREGELDPDHNLLYHLVLGSFLSITIFIFTSLGLNSIEPNPVTGLGSVNPQNLWLSLITISIALFILGWWRGAFPNLGKIHPSLARLPKIGHQSILIYPKSERETILERRKLAKEKYALVKEIEHTERWMNMASGERRQQLRNQRKSFQKKLSEVDARLQEIEDILMDQTE